MDTPAATAPPPPSQMGIDDSAKSGTAPAMGNRRRCPSQEFTDGKMISLISDALTSSRSRAFKRDGISRTQRSGGEDNDPPHLGVSSSLHQPPLVGPRVEARPQDHARKDQTSETDHVDTLRTPSEHTHMPDCRIISDERYLDRFLHAAGYRCAGAIPL